MSIAVLNQVYDEARRLAVAGSVVAKGDFRLKKLVPPLEQAGAKAPVFAKVAEAANKVIDGPEDSSAESLLELTSMVSAVLYTQGETGAAGEMQPIETRNLGGELAQTSARLLKPLLEALTSTGSGRLVLIEDAHGRGAFRDLRLIKPALNGLDDPYAEVGDFLAEKVLPMYGRAILPELRKAYEGKAMRGHPRRLKVMHVIDPAGTRDLVKQALEGGTKDIKLAAISCLGADKEDLQFLIEQTASKTQDVRAAAYEALSAIDDPAAVDVIQKAITGKDRGIAIDAMTLGEERPRPERLTSMLVAEVRKSVDELLKVKDKKKVSDVAERITDLIRALPTTDHAGATGLVLELFDRRAELAKVKGPDYSGSDVVEAVIGQMEAGPKSQQLVLARAHADLDGENLEAAATAGRESLPPEEFFNRYSPYLTAGADGKTGKGPSKAQREAVISALDAEYIAWSPDDTENEYQAKLPPLDSRWLDLAIKIRHIGLVNVAGRPGHAGSEAFLQKEFDALPKGSKGEEKLSEILTVMVRYRHPKATDNLLASYEKTIGKANAYTYWFFDLVPGLPKSAQPRLEALAPRLKAADADMLVEAIGKLRNKND